MDSLMQAESLAAYALGQRRGFILGLACGAALVMHQPIQDRSPSSFRASAHHGSGFLGDRKKYTLSNRTQFPY